MELINTTHTPEERGREAEEVKETRRWICLLARLTSIYRLILIFEPLAVRSLVRSAKGGWKAARQERRWPAAQRPVAPRRRTHQSQWLCWRVRHLLPRGSTGVMRTCGGRLVECARLPKPWSGRRRAMPGRAPQRSARAHHPGWTMDGRTRARCDAARWGGCGCGFQSAHFGLECEGRRRRSAPGTVTRPTRVDSPADGTHATHRARRRRQREHHRGTSEEWPFGGGGAASRFKSWLRSQHPPFAGSSERRED